MQLRLSIIPPLVLLLLALCSCAQAQTNNNNNDNNDNMPAAAAPTTPSASNTIPVITRQTTPVPTFDDITTIPRPSISNNSGGGVSTITKSPTSVPSRSPSESPSTRPTRVPTIVPSRSPSQVPSGLGLLLLYRPLPQPMQIQVVGRVTTPNQQITLLEDLQDILETTLLQALQEHFVVNDDGDTSILYQVSLQWTLTEWQADINDLHTLQASAMLGFTTYNYALLHSDTIGAIQEDIFSSSLLLQQLEKQVELALRQRNLFFQIANWSVMEPSETEEPTGEPSIAWDLWNDNDDGKNENDDMDDTIETPPDIMMDTNMNGNAMNDEADDLTDDDDDDNAVTTKNRSVSRKTIGTALAVACTLCSMALVILGRNVWQKTLQIKNDQQVRQESSVTSPKALMDKQKKGTNESSPGNDTIKTMPSNTSESDSSGGGGRSNDKGDDNQQQQQQQQGQDDPADPVANALQWFTDMAQTSKQRLIPNKERRTSKQKLMEPNKDQTRSTTIRWMSPNKKKGLSLQRFSSISTKWSPQTKKDDGPSKLQDEEDPSVLSPASLFVSQNTSIIIPTDHESENDGDGAIQKKESITVKEHQEDHSSSNQILLQKFNNAMEVEVEQEEDEQKVDLEVGKETNAAAAANTVKRSSDEVEQEEDGQEVDLEVGKEANAAAANTVKRTVDASAAHDFVPTSNDETASPRISSSVSNSSASGGAMMVCMASGVPTPVMSMMEQMEDNDEIETTPITSTKALDNDDDEGVMPTTQEESSLQSSNNCMNVETATTAADTSFLTL